MMDLCPPSSLTANVLSTISSEFDSARYPRVVDGTTLSDMESNKSNDGTRTPGTSSPPPPPVSTPLQSEEDERKDKSTQYPKHVRCLFSPPGSPASEAPEKLGLHERAPSSASPRRRFEHVSSAAADEWERERIEDRTLQVQYPAISQLMELVGLEEVKAQVLAIRDRIQICQRQRINLKKERFHIVFQGNPGTG